jgi:organic radical activating enzyme
MRNNYKAVTQKIDTEAELKVKFWDWMDRKSSALRRFHILGGEPMLQQDFMKCLEHWEDHPNPDVELNIISNLMVPEKQFETYIDYIKQLATTGKIKRFDLTASIDSWFPEQEYVRMGLDLEVFEKNMEYLMQQDESWLRINVNQTVSALTIKQMPTLIRKINKWKGQRTEFGHYFQKLTEPALMAPTIFPPEFFKASFNDVIAEMQNVTWDEQHAYKMMKGMIAQIDAQAKFDPEKISQLESYLNEIDDRRGSTWDLAFPWLCDWLTAYNRNR